MNQSRPIDRALAWAKQKGWNQSTLAARLGVAPANVTNWKIRGLPPEQYKPVADALGKTVDELLGGVATRSAEVLEVATEAAGKSVKVPMLAVTASMGRGEDQPGEDIVTGTIAVSSDWVAQQLRIDPARLRFINGYGDSMAPTFNSGDVLLVDTGTTSVVVDGIYVLATDSRLFIKRVRERLDGRYEISSDNPLVKTVDELDGGHEVDVLGRVVWVWNGKKV